jgi:hypothetical protein
MFPGFRQLVAAVIASITALIFGFGLFAAMRVSYAPLARLSYAAPVPISADHLATRRVTAAEPFAFAKPHGERADAEGVIPVMAYAEPTAAERIDAAMRALPVPEDRPPLSINLLKGDLTASIDKAVAPSTAARAEPQHVELTIAELPHDESPASPHQFDAAALHVAAAPAFGAHGGDIPAAPAPVRVAASPAAPAAAPGGRFVVRFVNGARAGGYGDGDQSGSASPSQYRDGWAEQPAAAAQRGRAPMRRGSDGDVDSGFSAFGH